MAAPARRGTLILVVGPSGAGKDALISYCRDRLAHDANVVFPQRVITRQQGAAGEDHASLTMPDFAAAVATGGFALRWEAHGFAYGIPAAIVDDLAAGRTVVANVSRAVIADARRCFQPVRIVIVTAPRAVLAVRLAARGRETPVEIERRLNRQVEAEIAGADVLTIDNSAELEAAGKALMAIITST